ncbi:MAG: cytochrome P450 [Sciscionella sp.]
MTQVEYPTNTFETLPTETPTETQPTQTLPRQRSCPFDPPARVAELQAEAPVSQLALPGGYRGWLVTRYDDVRSVLADQRFTTDRSRVNSPIREIPEELRRATQPGMFISQDPPEHTRYRKLLTGQFTVRRMRELSSRIEEFVTERLDAMVAAGPPADLVEMFALPVPSLVICELLGVDYDDRAEFQERTAKLLRLETSLEEVRQVGEGIKDFMLRLVRDKRERPTDDMISGLITGAAGPTGEGLTDEELSNMSLLLLVAGHETTANMLGLSTMALLEHPDQLDRLRADPSLIPGAVEELLRYLSILQMGAVRVAQEDIELGGQLIREGQTVILHIPQANRDPEHYGEPDRLDVTRTRVRHVAFGHGVHQCLGQQLARVELVVGLTTLLERFPTLRLAVPPEEIPMREDMAIYGAHKLPISW